MASCAFIGKGKLYLDGRFVGNVSALNLAITEDKVSQTDYTGPGGGNCATVSRIDAVEMTLTMTSYDPENLALAVFGSAANEAAGTVTDEAQTTPAEAATQDTLVVTDKLIDTSGTTTVTGTGGTPSYVEGTDFTVSPAGITVLAAGSIGGGTDIEISYDNLGVDVVQALQTSPKEYVATFDGLNEADNGNPIVLKGYKAKFGPTEDLALISDEFAELTLTGDLLKDETIVTPGLSQYFTMSVVR